jgi:aminoglycoside phosphotransferase (APT) family kinase protein
MSVEILYAPVGIDIGGNSGSPDAGVPDPDVLARRISELTGTDYEITAIERAATGFVNGTLLLESTPAPLVVKVQADGAAVYRSEPFIEPLVLRGLRAGGAPVPAVVAVEPDPRSVGSPWFAMERIDAAGIPDDTFTGYMVEGWFAEASAAERRRVCETFVECLARVHAVPVEGFAGLDRGGSHSRAIDYLRAAVDDAAPGRVPRQQRLLDLLVERMPAGADDDITLCMGDSRLANALVREAEVVALVDWEIAYLGNPAADIGYAVNHVGWLTHTSGTRLEGMPTAAETWDQWESLSGRRVPEADRRYWEAFGAMIITITATRVIASFLGKPSDPEAEDVNNMLIWSEGLFDG